MFLLRRHVRSLLRGGYRIYINGAGSGARELYRYICRYYGSRIPLEAFLVNDSYYANIGCDEMLGFPILPLSSLDGDDPRILLMTGYSHYTFYKEKIKRPDFKGIFIGEDILCAMDKTGNGEYLDYDYYIGHEREFEECSSLWADERSREIMEAYINQRISGRFSYLEKFWEPNQYFVPDIVDLRGVRCFVDGGAYDGDTYRSFLRNYRTRAGQEFTGSVFLWEPEEENFTKLSALYGKDDRVRLVKRGMWNEKAHLGFSGNGTGGGISAEGSGSVAVDRIDDVVDTKVDFIKMDIEGAEYNALLGAEETIRRDKPVLAVCAYHRREDLLRLPKFILSMNPDYRLYLRIHSPHAQELVIYAVGGKGT